MAEETDVRPHQSKPANESLFETPPMAEQERMVEAILFATAEPISSRELEARMPHGCDAAEALVHLRKRYEGRGVHVVRVGDGYAMRTAADSDLKLAWQEFHFVDSAGVQRKIPPCTRI